MFAYPYNRTYTLVARKINVDFQLAHDEETEYTQMIDAIWHGF